MSETSILYLGDTRLDAAASYLGGMIARAGYGFDYVPTGTVAAAALFEKPRKLFIFSDFEAATTPAECQQAVLRQVEAGYAWWYEYYKRDQSEADQRAYAAAEQQARGSRVGLWSESAPINPYDWRQGKRSVISATDAEPFQCGEKQYCKEMLSCAEAKFYLASCGLTKLDGDGDGMPCESLCR